MLVFNGDLWTSRYKVYTFDLIKSLCRREGPWVVFGDFNEILVPNEKMEGRERPEQEMRDFRDVISDCTQRDLGFQGPMFTWFNGREGLNCISESWIRTSLTLSGLTSFPKHS